MLWYQLVGFSGSPAISCGVKVGGLGRELRPGLFTPAVGWTSFQRRSLAADSFRKRSSSDFTNAGNKYGSYEVCLNGRQLVLVSRIQFGFGTNNEAEFDAFEAALKWTVEKIKFAGNNPSQFELEAYSDSTVVVNRINRTTRGAKKEPQKRMAMCAVRCLNYTNQFASFKAFWNGRKNNVSLFGH